MGNRQGFAPKGNAVTPTERLQRLHKNRRAVIYDGMSSLKAQSKPFQIPRKWGYTTRPPACP